MSQRHLSYCAVFLREPNNKQHNNRVPLREELKSFVFDKQLFDVTYSTYSRVVIAAARDLSDSLDIFCGKLSLEFSTFQPSHILCDRRLVSFYKQVFAN